MSEKQSLMDKISGAVKNTLKSDLVKAGACGALFLASPTLPALAGLAAVAGAVGLGYFSGKHVQKKTLLRTLEAGEKQGTVRPSNKRQR